MLEDSYEDQYKLMWNYIKRLKEVIQVQILGWIAI